MQVGDHIELSVIIPTFKRKESLFILLSALAAQQNVALEVIIVDQNPSGYFTDQEESKLAERIWLKQEKPNASTARNLGFINSKGSYILFIDDDLVPQPDFCKRAVDVFSQFPDIGCFFPNVFNELGPEISLQNAFRQSVGQADSSTPFKVSEAISAAVFFTRECYAKSGGFDPFIFEFARTAEDQEFFIRMGKEGITLWFEPNLQIYHNENVAGGCELRTDAYWRTRERCILSWTLRYRVHNPRKGKLGFLSLWKLSRSSFLNKKVLLAGFAEIAGNFRILRDAVKRSKQYYSEKKGFYTSGKPDFLVSVKEYL